MIAAATLGGCVGFLIAALAVVQLLSVTPQVAMYKRRKVRLFKMAPFHHHFEMSGWPETTLMVKFRILAAMSAPRPAALFYTECRQRPAADVLAL